MWARIVDHVDRGSWIILMEDRGSCWSRIVNHVDRGSWITLIEDVNFVIVDPIDNTRLAGSRSTISRFTIHHQPVHDPRFAGSRSTISRFTIHHKLVGFLVTRYQATHYLLNPDIHTLMFGTGISAWIPWPPRGVGIPWPPRGVGISWPPDGVGISCQTGQRAEWCH